MSASEKFNQSAGRSSSNREKRMFGSSLDFAAKEAYKLLRTNLEFALADVEGCRVIGITSATRGEGKSLTSINICYTLAEYGKRVLLIEGDLRLPTLSRKLSLSNGKGLSNIIADSSMRTIPIRKYSMKTKEDEGVTIDILTSGSVPPNPSELLGSERMKLLMKALRNNYDYILIDLPPVLAVTDALVASKVIDGMVIVVRNAVTEKNAYADAIRQMKFANTRILGCVLNCVDQERETKKGYYHYSRYYEETKR